MHRALHALTVAAYLTLVAGVAVAEPPVTMPHHPVAAIVLGAVYAGAATAGFARIRSVSRRGPRVAYVVAQLVSGYAVFVASGASVGAILLLLVLVSQSVLLLPSRGALLVVGLVPFAHLGMAWRPGLREGLGMLAAAAFAAVLTRLIVREQLARQELTRAHEQLREYALQVERLAVAQERNRVARDIHDGLGHSLTVVQMQVKAARAVLGTDPGRADAVLAKAQEQAEEALAEVRRSVGAMRDPRAQAPLAEALRELAEQASASGVPTSLDIAGQARPLLTAAQESLYRAAQEGLTNVRKHAGATRAALVLDYTAGAAVRLEVRDDGTGLPAEITDLAGYGLLGVRERAAHAGGRMSIASVPGQGATLSVEVPG
ncbi:sensor histidine kinase [Catellatospora methionotrophica]|uniref:sensor histidine kinase n=1 Tax=Catellatospora methionotrophica TaxID=121620 RepID=UPI0019446B92|nr:sensor histidine kinase [Catellatospora methionotrophica]